MKKKKSWVEKLNDNKGLPMVEEITGKLTDKWGEGTVVIPAPREVNEIMKQVPEGKLITINEIRTLLAQKHEATIGCPLTTGIFAWIAAYAAEEEACAGKKDTTPYWRTLKSRGEINPKYPGGPARQKELLEAEGHEVIQKGNRFFVASFEKSLHKK